MDAIPEMEAEDGSIFLLEQLRSAIKGEEFVGKLQMELQEGADALMLAGVGEVFPFMRLHSLLEALQPHFSLPIVALYPGKYDGRQLKLFDQLQPNDYYRAFNIV